MNDIISKRGIHHRRGGNMDYPKLIKATRTKSCDTCESQEGRHYCLLHGVQVKNMNIKRCIFWSQDKEI